MYITALGSVIHPSSHVLAQNSIKPITKRDLISFLQKGRKEKKPAAHYIHLIRQYGVPFLMMPEHEKEIRRVGSYLGEEGLGELITALYDNYRPSNGDVYADMTLYEENTQFPESQYPGMMRLPSDTTLKYSYTRVKGDVVIDYEMPYLSLLDRGGPIKPFYNKLGSSPLFWQFPKLALKVINNSSKTLMFTEAAITVNKSEVITDPVLTINPGIYYFKDGQLGGTDLGSFHFINYGWGNVLAATVNLKIQSPGDFPELDGQEKNIRVGTFSEVASINILEGLPKPTPCDPGNEKGLPEFVTVQGAINYSTERAQQRAIMFETPVRVRFCSSALGASHNNADYDVQLEAGKFGYTKYVPLTQELGPGRTDYFIIRVGSDKSARYELTFSFRAPGYFIPDKTVKVAVFMPRSTGYSSDQARKRVMLTPK